MSPESTPHPASSLPISPRREAWDDIVLPALAVPLTENTKSGIHFGKKNLVMTASSIDTPTQYPGGMQLTMICIGLILGNFLVALDTSIIGTSFFHFAKLWGVYTVAD